MQLQTRTITRDITGVGQQVEEATRIVKEDIERSSKGTSQALQSLHQSWAATASEMKKKTETLSAVTVQT
jgi:hypothetical protein